MKKIILIAAAVAAFSVASCRQSRAEQQYKVVTTEWCSYRSAVTGRYVTRTHATLNPQTTYRTCTTRPPRRK